MSTGGIVPGLKSLSSTKLVDLEAAWREREVEAAAPTAAGYIVMGLVLRLYCLEIRIKTVVCKTLTVDRLPVVCKTHRLEELLIFTGLWAELNDPRNIAVKNNWDVLATFSMEKLNDTRYLPTNSFPPGDLLKVESGSTIRNTEFGHGSQSNPEIS